MKSLNGEWVRDGQTDENRASERSSTKHQFKIGVRWIIMSFDKKKGGKNGDMDAKKKRKMLRINGVAFIYAYCII